MARSSSNRNNLDGCDLERQPYSPNPNDTLTLIPESRDPDYHQNLIGSSVAHVSPFHRIL